ncbi:MAG: FmdE family protein [Nitrospirae bacterium]|nr:FmdE family protein [Nitrospirota bacterium]MCL5978028.1 FmdE family protein [Nitrospirota bacterium]
MKTFDDVVNFHGHSCPGLVFGYRAALAAMREMDMENISEDEEIVAIVENDSCAVDAVQVFTGCTFGKGNLIFKDYGKQVYTFLKRPSGDAVRVAIDFIPPEETAEEKEMWRRYSEGDRSEDVLKAVHNRKAKKMKAILDAPDSELLKITRFKMQLPAEAKIYPSVKCEMCGEKVAEPKARVKDGKVVCIPCFEA